MPRIFTLVSVAIHSVVLAFVFLAQTFDVGALPTPRKALAFETPIAKMAPDVPLPAPRRAAASSEHAVAAATAPVTAPEGVKPETGHEGLPTVVNPDLVSSVEPSGEPCNCIIGDSVLPAPPPQPPAPQKPVHLHQGIQPPRKIVDVQPVYPVIARESRQQGVVILETVIDAKGGVEQVRVLRGYPLLDQAAIDAVRQWRFTPALLNGQPVPVVMTVTVNFVLQ
jgi:protein TonB